MNKGMIILGVAAVIIAAYFLFYHKNEIKPLPHKNEQQKTGKSKNNNQFNTSFNSVLGEYYNLKNALVNWDTASANNAAINLKNSIDKIPLNQVNIDSVENIRNAAESASAEAEGLVMENSIDEKRMSFYTLSEALYSLIKMVHYDQQVIYHQKCPMAFKGTEEGWWLSNSSEIVNPYLGNKHPKYHAGMLNCGSVEDSIDYRNN